MTTLRQAVHEYVRMRRDLGFKLHEAGKGLLDFVTFMEQHRAASITQALALAWAQQPSHVQPAHWAQRLSFVRGFAQYRSATDLRTQIPAAGLLPFSRSGRDRTCTRMRRFVISCAPRSPCPAAMNAGSYAPGSTTVCSGS